MIFAPHLKVDLPAKCPGEVGRTFIDAVELGKGIIYNTHPDKMETQTIDLSLFSAHHDVICHLSLSSESSTGSFCHLTSQLDREGQWYSD